MFQFQFHKGYWKIQRIREVYKSETLLSERRTKDAIFGDVIVMQR